MNTAFKIDKHNVVYCFDPHMRKLIRMGVVDGKTFIKSVEPKHFFRNKGGYGLQYEAYIELMARNIKEIHISEIQTGIVWKSSIYEWLKNKDIADYGRGKQIFLPLSKMHR